MDWLFIAWFIDRVKEWLLGFDSTHGVLWVHLSDCLWNTPTPQLESQIVLACVQRRPFIVLWNSCQGLSEFLYAYTQVSFLWPFFTRPGPRPFRALVRSERPGLKYTSQDAVHHIHRFWRDIIEYLLLRLSQKWPTQPCAPNSRVWRLGENVRREKTSMRQLWFAFCYLDRTLPGSRNVVPRVQHEEFEASQFRYNWQPPGPFELTTNWQFLRRRAAPSSYGDAVRHRRIERSRRLWRRDRSVPTCQTETSRRSLRLTFRCRPCPFRQLPPWLPERRGGQALRCNMNTVDSALLPITQDHDGGAAAAAKVRQLGHAGLRVHPVGGARFTHRNRQLNFEWILCDLWKYQGAQFSTVVVVWAGNDLKWWMTPEELENAIKSLKESCTKWQVELRLIDVVGRSYF